MPGASRGAQHAGGGAVQHGLQRGHGGLRGGIGGPFDAARARRVAHVQAAVGVDEKHRAGLRRAGHAVVVRACRDGHRRGMHQRLHVGRVGVAQGDVGQFRVQQRA
jgi:hypothetical protein